MYAMYLGKEKDIKTKIKTAKAEKVGNISKQEVLPGRNSRGLRIMTSFQSSSRSLPPGLQPQATQRGDPNFFFTLL